MVKASGQIEQELKQLQHRTQEMADALEPIYEGYLKALSEAGNRQLMLAAYHLCTQAYPDKFLALSWDQRNQLQQSLQALSSKIYEQLIAHRTRTKTMSRRSQQHNGLEFLQRLLESKATAAKTELSDGDTAQTLQQTEPDSPDADNLETDRADTRPPETNTPETNAPETDSPGSGHHSEEEKFEGSDFESSGFEKAGFEEARLESIDFEGEQLDASLAQNDEDGFDFEMDVPAADQRLTLSEEDDLLAALEGLARRSISNQPGATDEERPLVPIHLVKQQVLLEKAIRDVFATVSEEANELLRKADIMPVFPKALIAAATDSRGMGEPMNAVPNVVKMSVRVMQGEAFLEEDDDDLEELVDERREARKHRHQRSRDRRSRRSSQDESERFSREEGPPIRRIIARDAMEIEALPELAAISLRLSEVEFTDPTVSAWRGRLRKKLSELKQLGVRYKKTQRALETAQAEDAWRSSWIPRSEESDE